MTPLTPSNCDLRDFAFMPLDVVRLRDSDLSALSSGDEFRAAVLLWCASWHQTPAASLPDDDKVLSQLAGYGRVVKEWKTVRDGALRGWIKCSDGRLYHPVVAEKANESWRAKLKQRWTTECARIKKYNQRHGTEHPYPELDTYLSGSESPNCPQGHGDIVPEDTPPMSPQSPSGNTIQGTGIGTGRVLKTNSSDNDDVLVKGESSPSSRPVDPITTRAIELTTLLRPRGASLQHADPNVRRWAADGITDADALRALEIAQDNRAKTGSTQPISSGYLTPIIAEIAGGQIVKPFTRTPHGSAGNVNRQEAQEQRNRDALKDWTPPESTGDRYATE
ncbi:DUF1376 domain-containing protein [Chitinimonas naiadis]